VIRYRHTSGTRHVVNIAHIAKVNKGANTYIGSHAFSEIQVLSPHLHSNM
jgi:hypothetical protein